MCVSPRSPHLFFGKLFYWRAMSLSLVRLDSGRRKLSRWTPWNSCQMFYKLCLPLICTQKKGKFRTRFQNILFTGQFLTCFITARGKSKIVCKEFVSSFFLVNLTEGQFFVTAEDRHLWKVSETLKEFTLPVIFSSLSQQRNRHC